MKPLPEQPRTPLSPKVELQGIYRCVHCGAKSREWLPISRKELYLAVQLVQNPFLSVAQKHCPQCGRYQWLEKVVDVHSGEVIPIQQLLASAIQQLRRPRRAS